MMKSQSPRQLGLYFAACLYQLASEFDSEELAIILKEHRSHGHSKAIIAAIRAIQDLHASEGGLQVPQLDPTSAIEGEDLNQYSGLTESPIGIFRDQTKFPTVSSIAEVTRFVRKPKEARDRYMVRLQKYVESLSNEERRKFFKGISQRINKSQDNFVSKWSDLIQNT